MGIIRIATLRRNVARPWELAAAHIVQAVILHGVEHHVVLYHYDSQPPWPAHSMGSNLGYYNMVGTT